MSKIGLELSNWETWVVAMLPGVSIGLLTRFSNSSTNSAVTFPGKLDRERSRENEFHPPVNISCTLYTMNSKLRRFIGTFYRDHSVTKNLIHSKLLELSDEGHSESDPILDYGARAILPEWLDAISKAFVNLRNLQGFIQRALIIQNENIKFSNTVKNWTWVTWWLGWNEGNKYAVGVNNEATNCKRHPQPRWHMKYFPLVITL